MGRKGVAGAAFDQGYDGALVVFANDGVSFPVTHTGLAFHDLRAVFDAHAVLEHAPAFTPPATALAQCLLATQTPPKQLGLIALVAVDVLVDTLCLGAAIPSMVKRPLTWLERQAKAQVGADMCPLECVNAMLLRSRAWRACADRCA